MTHPSPSPETAVARVAVISAGLSVPSSTRLLADQLTNAVRDDAAARGLAVAFDVIELRPLAVPLAQMMTTGLMPVDAVIRAHSQLAEASAVIAVTPVFTASYSGLFKMFLDTLDVHLLDGKPVLIAATAGTPRHSLVLEHALRPVFSYLHATVLPTGVFAATEDFGAGSGTGLSDRVRRAAGELVTALAVGAVGASVSTDSSTVSVPEAATAPAATETASSGSASSIASSSSPSAFERLLRGHSG